jgi:xanthine dehydrogenase accessory factor
MTDLLEHLESWRAAGRRIAVATVVGIDGSAPRDLGSSLAVNDAGEVAGSVSGGCVEAAVYQEASEAIATGKPRLVIYGISDEEAIEHGLTCGGTIRVFVERLDW